MKPVYTTTDLASRELLDQGASQPARLAVLGKPIKHSASPGMHQAALDHAGLDMRFIRLEVEPGEIKETLNKMQELGFVGCNITVPHKLEAIDACDQLTEDAQAIGAINTILFDNGSIIGHNTDAPGLARAIHEEFGVDLGDLRVMVLGTGGGAGRAIATQCARLGCDQIWLVNRTVEKAQSLAEELQNYYRQSDHLAGPGDALYAMTPDDPGIEEAAGHADLIINATPLGMQRMDPLPLSGSCIQPHHMVYDAIYTPPVTALLAAANAAGARGANGLSMLLHQGALAFDFWFPGQANTTVMKQGLTGQK
ncbi:shikimate dehydrogenase [Verrucomicrobiaceae bacterium N1E253]|uniref:Shikimate dehydrogenase (NADP(+)) n=1 Tax=Oceaniferula marina TaxID=2748318 RepID=A0A851GJB5_9BACT|nr:shikimate dehydrogenase [Oceaniferula marina]NWK55197.1 shikimate dehydrogenase [Oceaniferula marina]